MYYFSRDVVGEKTIKKKKKYENKKKGKNIYIQKKTKKKNYNLYKFNIYF